MTPAQDPIQAQLIAARRNQILDAATKVFAEKGFHPTTINDIAKEAGIAHGTIYTYFGNKTALLLGIFERMRAAVIQENPPPMPRTMDNRTFIRAFISLPLQGLKQNNFALMRVIISEMMVNEELRTLYYKQVMEPTWSMVEGYLGEQTAKWGLSPEKISLLIRTISAMILGLTIEYSMGDSILEKHWENLPDFLTDLIVKGLNEEK